MDTFDQQVAKRHSEKSILKKRKRKTLLADEEEKADPESAAATSMPGLPMKKKPRLAEEIQTGEVQEALKTSKVFKSLFDQRSS